MLYYRCPECSQESPMPDDQAGRAVKCPHCGMLGMAYGVSIREVPAAAAPEIVVPPPSEQPEESEPPRAPEPPELPEALEAPSGPDAAPPEAPELEPIEPAGTTPDRQEAPVRRVEPYRVPRPARPMPPAAMASVILGVVGMASFCCGGGLVFGVAAAATGLAALAQMSKSPGMYAAGGRGMAKAGLTLGLIAFVLSLIVLLATIRPG